MDIDPISISRSFFTTLIPVGDLDNFFTLGILDILNRSQLPLLKFIAIVDGIKTRKEENQIRNDLGKAPFKMPVFKTKDAEHSHETEALLDTDISSRIEAANQKSKDNASNV